MQMYFLSGGLLNLFTLFLPGFCSLWVTILICFSCFFMINAIIIFRYESEFFQNVVNARDIVSWAAVDRSRPNGHSDELIGFVTARIVMAKDSEVGLQHF